METEILKYDFFEREGKYMYYDGLTKQYALSKTIRNELVPIGKTLDNIKKNRILETDIKRKSDYEHVKKLMDMYHKKIINEALDNFKLSGLEDAADIYFNKQNDERGIDAFLKIQDKLRKEIVEQLKGHTDYSKVGNKDFLGLLKAASTEEDRILIESFDNFYTYFTSYNKVRSNLYSAEDKSSTVAYRLINENLPKFFDNIKAYRTVRNAGVISGDMSIVEQDGLFEVDTFNHTLTQYGIDTYNHMIGQLNSAINLYNQKMHGAGSFKKLPKMKELYKQLLTEREEEFIEEYTDDEVLITSVHNYVSYLIDYLNSDKVESFFDTLRKSDGKEVFIKNDVSKTTMSNILFENWSTIDDLINQEYDSAPENVKKTKNDKYFEKRQKDLKKNKSYSLSKIAALCRDTTILEKYIRRLVDDIEKIYTSNNVFSDIVLSKHDRSKKLSKNTNAVQAIKNMLDSIKDFEHDVMLINGSGQEIKKNLNVYSEQEALAGILRQVDHIYNLTRNYLTKKPFSTEKIKLNFNRPTFLDGWDKNKEEANLGILLIKDNRYYLGIMNTSSNKAFVNPPKAISNDIYKKVDYKLLPGPNKMLPKVFFATKNIAYYAPSEELLSKYRKGTHKKGDSFSIDDCRNLIDFFKSSINKNTDWSTFGFNFSDTNSYNDISDFYREVEKQGYKLSFTDIDACYIKDLVDNNELYLFQIYNKDFSPYSKGKLNLHTLYFKMLFDQRNLDNVVYKLNGEAEVFYRPASIESDEQIIHKSGQNIKNKNQKRSNCKKTSTFDYDIVKDRRYCKDKFMLHLPITVNFGTNESGKFNELVNNAIRADKDVNVIGIDRGERNLLYVVVVDPCGKIIEQISLNTIVDKEYDIETDYHQLLDEKEGSRDKARKDWNTIENIKELKEGYLSQVVNIIAKLVLKYDAIICLEDLNIGFKRGRQKVEKQVYQKFEKMLIDKMNYLVLDKSRKQESPQKPGGALNALQLTSAFKSFKELGKQTGIIYYVPAYLTSKIDPTTGFANLFYIKYESVDKARDFFSKFDFIRYNQMDNYFEFGFDYKSFTERASGCKSKWIACTNGERIVKYRNSDKNNSFDDKTVILTDEYRSLFDKYLQNYIDEDDLKDQILQIDSADFYKNLIKLFQLTLQMRNSSLDGKRDYIISPVKNYREEFFCSEFSDDTFPRDADANGAYNIARKGLWVIKQIRETKSGTKINLAMSNSEWLEYAQCNLL